MALSNHCLQSWNEVFLRKMCSLTISSLLSGVLKSSEKKVGHWLDKERFWQHQRTGEGGWGSRGDDVWPLRCDQTNENQREKQRYCFPASQGVQSWRLHCSSYFPDTLYANQISPRPHVLTPNNTKLAITSVKNKLQLCPVVNLAINF